MKVSELKGMKVLDSIGNEVGQIVDVKIDLVTMKVKKIVVGKGGISGAIGMGDDIAISVKHIKEVGDVIVLDAVVE